MARAPGRWLLVRAALAEESRAAPHAFARFLAGARLARVPTRLLFAPQDLRGADPAVAAEMASGLFVFADDVAQLRTGSPFGVPAPSEAWSEELFGFGWLRHLRAGDEPGVRAMARALVGEAIGPRRRELSRGIARRTRVVARRLVSFLAHSPLLMTGADHVFYRRALKAIGRDVVALEGDLRTAPRPLDRLAAAIALCFAGLCCEGLEAAARRGSRALSTELEAQILPDGGHVGRNPATLIDLLLDLLPLRLLFESRGVAVPPALEGAISRMMPMLRFFQLGSGDLALFNGMGRTPPDELATLMAHDEGRIPFGHCFPSGYDRMEAGRTVVVVDTGRAPPLPASNHAHAGFLAFELGSGLDRIVVNGGSPPRAGPACAVARRAGAHSTLVIADATAATILDAEADTHAAWPVGPLVRRFGPILYDGPREAGSELSSEESGVVLSARHDGYRESHGVVHARRLHLAASGEALEGEDILTRRPGAEHWSERGAVAAELRFHLHPSVVATLEGPEGPVRLDLPGGERWLFGAHGAVPRLEPSSFYAVLEGRRATRRIVLPLPFPPEASDTRMRWAFRRVERAETG